MKFFKKINRGLILLTVLVLSVVIYLTALHFSRISDKNDISSLTRRYMDVFSEGMPLADRSAKTAMTEIKKEQLPFFASENAAEPTFDSIEYLIDDQEKYGKIENFSVKVTKISNFLFDGNTATADVSMQITYEGPSEIMQVKYDTPSDVTVNTIKKTYEHNSNIVYQKVGGEWKIFYYDGQLIYEDSYIID